MMKGSVHAWEKVRAMRVMAAAMVFLLCLALSGCASRGPGTRSDRLYLDTSQEPCGHLGRQIEILQEPPSRAHTRVAYVEAYVAFYAQDEVSWQMLRTDLCHQASSADADAIIELTVGSRPYSRLVEIVGFEVSEGGSTKKLTGIAIRYDSSDKP
jgi:hypothetical protein